MRAASASASSGSAVSRRRPMATGSRCAALRRWFSDRVAAAGLLQSPDQVRQRNIRLEVDDEAPPFFRSRKRVECAARERKPHRLRDHCASRSLHRVGDAADRQCDALQSRAFKARSKDIGPGYVHTAIGRARAARPQYPHRRKYWPSDRPSRASASSLRQAQAAPHPHRSSS